jgi:hypothetical protein
MAQLAAAAPVGLLVSAGFVMAQSSTWRHLPSAASSGQSQDTAEAPKIDPKAILKHNEQEIHEDVEKLYTLATQLKTQVEKTDSTHVLSVSLIESARQIETLAKHIKSLATA